MEPTATSLAYRQGPRVGTSATTVTAGPLRPRANTLEKSEQIRPPVRRKRRTSIDFTGSGGSGNEGRDSRSGSVPPEAALHLPQPTSISESNPQPLPRLRRVTAKPMLMLHNTSSVSQPNSSGNNTPSRGSLDLSDLTPFGRCDSPKGESGGVSIGAGGRPIATSATISSGTTPPHRNSSIRRNKWNWIWGSNRPSTTGGNSSRQDLFTLDFILQNLTHKVVVN